MEQRYIYYYQAVPSGYTYKNGSGLGENPEGRRIFGVNVGLVYCVSLSMLPTFGHIPARVNCQCQAPAFEPHLSSWQHTTPGATSYGPPRTRGVRHRQGRIEQGLRLQRPSRSGPNAWFQAAGRLAASLDISFSHLGSLDGNEKIGCATAGADR